MAVLVQQLRLTHVPCGSQLPEQHFTLSRSAWECTSFGHMRQRENTPQQSAGSPGSAGARQGAARTPSGTISVTTTERGLPTALKIDARELKKSTQELAREILGLCQLAAMRAQVAHRRELVDQGRDASLINDLKLANEEDLAKAEAQLRGDDEELPSTWMRSV